MYAASMRTCVVSHAILTLSVSCWFKYTVQFQPAFLVNGFTHMIRPVSYEALTLWNSYTTFNDVYVVLRYVLFVAVSPAPFCIKIQFTCTKKEYSAQSTAVIYSNFVFWAICRKYRYLESQVRIWSSPSLALAGFAPSSLLSVNYERGSIK
jgi:hypothetical protein